MQVVKSLLRRVSAQAVCFSLQNGKVVEFRGLHGLCLFLHRLYPCVLSVTSLLNGFRSDLVVCLFAGSREAAAGDLRHIKRLALKRGDFRLSFYKKRQRRGHDAPHIERRAVKHGKEPCCIDPYDPIRTGAAKSRVIQPVIVLAGTEMRKALPDRFVLHTGNPKPLHRLLAFRVVIYQAKDQLALAPGVGGAHNAFHALVLHKPAEKIKLLFLVLRHSIFPALRQDRKILMAPLAVLLAVGVRLRQLQKVPEAPAHKIAAALQIPVFLFLCAQNRRQGHGDGGLFRNNKFHCSSLHFFVILRCSQRRRFRAPCPAPIQSQRLRPGLSQAARSVYPFVWCAARGSRCL